MTGAAGSFKLVLGICGFSGAIRTPRSPRTGVLGEGDPRIICCRNKRITGTRGPCCPLPSRPLLCSPTHPYRRIQNWREDRLLKGPNTTLTTPYNQN